MVAHNLVVEALIHKRAEVSGLILKAQKDLARLQADLRAIDRTLTLTGYAGDAKTIPPKRRFPKSEAVSLAERCAFVRDTLASAERPMRACEIATAYRAAQGVVVTDTRTRDFYKMRVSGALRTMRTRGEVVMEGKWMRSVWRLAARS